MADSCRESYVLLLSAYILDKHLYTWLLTLIFALLKKYLNHTSIMYAIVDIAGKQFKVTQDQFVYAPKMAGEEGASVEFNSVLLIGDGDAVEVGAPNISGAKVAGKILGHVKGDKVIVFKKKRRKGYKKKNGHRQEFTKVLIESISK
jgi:large subunit ribosomal protein L21